MPDCLLSDVSMHFTLLACILFHDQISTLVWGTIEIIYAFYQKG